MDYLTGHFLIAMPGMSDPRFAQSVVLLCEHSSNGAMGLIVNKPAREVRTGDLLDQLGISHTPEASAIRVHLGGPVEHARGFVLHSTDWDRDEGTLRISDEMAMTGTLDILEAIAKGEGPRRALLALGYAGWGPGQLEEEVRANGWLSCDGSADIVFHPESDRIWTLALRTLGVDARALSPDAGHA